MLRPCFFLCLLATALSLRPASAGPLATVTSSTVYATGNASTNASTVSGGFTAAGNASFRAVNMDSVQVQGNLTTAAVNISNGATYGNKFTSIASTFGSLGRMSTAATNSLANASAVGKASFAYGLLAPNGKSVAAPGGLLLKGTDPVLNIFSGLGPIDGKTLAFDVPAGSTVLVNFDRQDENISNANLNAALGSVGPYDPTLVLFNFPNAVTVNLFKDTISGTVLAPDSNVTISSTHSEGNLIGGNLSLSADNATPATFNDRDVADPGFLLRTRPTVPEPSSLVLFVLVILALLGHHLKRPRRSPGVIS